MRQKTNLNLLRNGNLKQFYIDEVCFTSPSICWVKELFKKQQENVIYNQIKQLKK